MKTLLLAALVPFAVQAQTSPSYWETAEYYRSRTLAPINASSAYARGYTGKGSTIAILDSGIDLKSPEFQNGKITLTKDFSGSGNVNDLIRHGTHVAGIAAAANNGVGMEGVAFGANLMVAKITNNGIISSGAMISALDWASTNRATVANLSASFSLASSTLKAQMIAPGVYSTVYTNKGIYPANMNPVQWASAMKNEIVLVVAAGNDGLAFPNAPGQLATATDSKGNLILGGRMIIAGNWNSQNNTIASSSNRAGTLCNTTVGNVCKDLYKTSDFYLMAPGMGITSTVPTSVNKSGYATLSGTSMSAPAISGGVAIISQMWPQMTGGNIVKLLMVTANKNLPGYDVNVMGQGLMDLEKATRPVGPVGIPTTGRVNAVTTFRPLIVTEGSAGTGKLNNILVMDSFQRDFYVKGKALTGLQPTLGVNINQVAMPYTSRNNYSQFNGYTDYQSIRNGDVEVSLYKNNTYNQFGDNPAMVEVSYYKNGLKFTTGSFLENTKWLGNTLSENNPAQSHTTFMGIGFDKNIKEDTQVYGNFMHGITLTKANSDLVKNLGPVLSYSWTLGIEQKLNEKNSVGVMFYQPVSVYHATANVDIPVGLDSNFDIVSARTINLAADVKEMRTGFYYKFNEKKKSNVLAFVESRQNYKGQAGLTDTVVGLTMSQHF